MYKSITLTKGNATLRMSVYKGNTEVNSALMYLFKDEAAAGDSTDSVKE